MTPPVAAFNDHMDQWKAGQQEPWMQLRYDLAQEYLRRYLPASPARILDIGGGNGYDAIPLAQSGHTVTIVDYSAAMLDDARQGARAFGVEDDVTLVEGTLDTLSSLVPPNSFDVALCHNILQYVDQPDRYLATIRSRLVPGGVFSIINPNPASEALQIACRQQDLASALAAINLTERFVPTFDVRVHRYAKDQVAQWLASAGFALRAHYGINCVCYLIADNAVKYEPQFYAQLLALETVMGETEPYMDIGRFMHLIAENSKY